MACYSGGHAHDRCRSLAVALIAGGRRQSGAGRSWLVPPGASQDATLLVCARGVRALGDGFVSVLLPLYLTRLGLDALRIGAITTGTLVGSAVLTLAVGLVAYRLPRRVLLFGASLLMVATGVAFAFVHTFWPLLIVAFAGTLNPSAGDVSVFLPLEQALVPGTVTDRARTALFGRYGLAGSLMGAVGALCAGIPALLATHTGVGLMPAVQTMFLAYGALALVAMALYRRLSPAIEPGGRGAGNGNQGAGPPEPVTRDAGPGTPKPERGTPPARPAPLRQSRRIVYRMAGLFSLDAFGGGFVVQSLLALWLFERFHLSLAMAGTIFFWTGLVSSASYLASARLAGRIGLVNTMVFTHLPSNIFLILAGLMPSLPLAIAFLLARGALSQMDVPARNSWVMAVVTPEERPAAASVTSVPRSLATALSPLLSGFLLGLTPFGWPLIIAGSLKATYDLLLLATFKRVRPPEEQPEPPLGGSP
ncbi:MAG: MFS transporter [Chloroflexota bacterium]